MKTHLNIYKLDLLIALYIGCIAIAELMGAKTIPLVQFGWLNLNASVAVFVVPVLFSINDIVAEVYGPERTRSIIRSGLLVIGLILLFSLLATYLPPSTRFANTEEAYDAIFGKSARIAAASLTAFATAEFLDVLIFMKLRRRLGKQQLWFRNNISNIAAQLVDTVIFMSLAFYAFDKPLADNAAFLGSLILPYWLLKCALSVIETPFVYLGVSWLRKGEKI